MNETNKKLSAIDDALIKQIADDLAKLRNEFYKFRDEINDKIANILD
jgi:hypothetical protein